MALPFLPIFGLVKTIASEWFYRRKKKQEHKTKMATMKHELKEKVMVTQINADVDIDRINTENMATSWKDEFLLIVFSIPVVMSFVPSLSVYVKEGFLALSETPIWFQTIYIVMCLTIYGHRKLARIFAQRALGIKLNGDKNADS